MNRKSVFRNSLETSWRQDNTDRHKKVNCLLLKTKITITEINIMDKAVIVMIRMESCKLSGSLKCDFTQILITSNL